MSNAVTPSELGTMLRQTSWYRGFTAQEQATLDAELPRLLPSLAAQDGEPGVSLSELEAKRNQLTAIARRTVVPQPSAPAAPSGIGLRQPAAAAPKAPAPTRVDAKSIVPELAARGVLVTINSFASRNADSGWLACFDELGKAIEQRPEILDAVHEVVIDRAITGAPAARLLHDPDGARRLVLTFDFERYTPRTLAEAPDPRAVGKPQGVRPIGPRAAEIAAAVAGAGPRGDVERYAFDRRFLIFMAQLRRLPQIDTSLVTQAGEPFAKKLLDQYGAEVGDRSIDELAAAYPFLGAAMLHSSPATPVLMIRPDGDQAVGVEKHWTSFGSWVFRWEVERARRAYVAIDPDADTYPTLAALEGALAQAVKKMRRPEDEVHGDLPDAQTR